MCVHLLRRNPQHLQTLCQSVRPSGQAQGLFVQADHGISRDNIYAVVVALQSLGRAVF